MTKMVPGIALCIALGLAGNFFGYPIFFSIDYLFGSIFSMLVLQAFRFIPGVVAACVISSITCFTTAIPILFSLCPGS